MSGALLTAEDRRPRGFSGLSPVVRSLAAVVLFPFDDVLRGMVAAGQGIEAICLFLGLERALLDGHLVRLGLRTPHDRPLRKPGVNGWSVMDTIRLIAWRVAGIHPETIGKRLGRSAGAVRSKARRLGLWAPARKLLHKPDPATLRDPEPGLGWRPHVQSPVPATREAACGRLAGIIAFRGRDAAASGATVSFVSFARSVEDTTGEKVSGSFEGSLGKLELPLFGVVDGTNLQPLTPSPAQNDANIAQSAPPVPLARPITAFVIPKAETEVDFGGDLTWIGTIRRPLTNKLVVWTCGMLLMSGLHYMEAAKRVGMSAAAFRTFRTRSGIPSDEDRTKYDCVFDEQIARDTLAVSGYRLRQCMTASQNHDGKGNWFWVERHDRSTWLSPPKRKRDRYIEGVSNRIKILKGKDARRQPSEISRPFAKLDGKSAGNSGYWRTSHA